VSLVGNTLPGQPSGGGWTKKKKNVQQYIGEKKKRGPHSEARYDPWIYRNKIAGPADQSEKRIGHKLFVAGNRGIEAG